MNPGVTVITPTWGRREILLDRCVPSVLKQTYDNVEHLIISDGPDPILRRVIADTYRVRLLELKTHDPTDRWGTKARLYGLKHANAARIAYLDDDNAYRPEHLERLTGSLSKGTDFVYSRMVVHQSTGSYEVGSAPPRYSHLDTSTIMHWKKLLDKATWRYTTGQQTIDWDLVDRWMRAGATWRFIPEITVDYYS